MIPPKLYLVTECLSSRLIFCFSYIFWNIGSILVSIFSLPFHWGNLGERMTGGFDDQDLDILSCNRDSGRTQTIKRPKTAYLQMKIEVRTKY